ncbi:hypothetical protein LPB136_09170 [Tenacibaculum todarodis]|uniref:Uncharacterized protein n=1 Tax=Tenacibaculum todarodis TaxID=1850252 RepID=A0A1L3JK73_9FLAO|nr:hypothetical protein [Tenacibaculum todarodis]APG65518.1 hypothetical protein LPB136_09170 [Tenacibaculum todarodis]
MQTELLFFILILAIVLIIYFIKDYYNIKTIEINKIHILSSEIHFEKSIAKKLKYSNKELTAINDEIVKKTQKIKVDILNIDYTLKEIF